jgi:hypothetical protein
MCGNLTPQESIPTINCFMKPAPFSNTQTDLIICRITRVKYSIVRVSAVIIDYQTIMAPLFLITQAMKYYPRIKLYSKLWMYLKINCQ